MSQQTTGEVLLSVRHGRAFRVAACGLGLGLIAGVLWDFRPVFAEFTLFTLPFGLIAAGAIAVGGTFALAGLLAENAEVVVVDGHVILHRQNAFRHLRQRLSRSDFVRVGITEHDWESRPPSYSVEIRLARGQPVQSRDYADRATAEALAARIDAAL